MKPIGFSIVITLLFVGIGFAQESAGQEYPFEGQVTGDYVFVRSGPDINYYPVRKLMKGDRVRVVGDELGWYKIIPPRGVFSWVAKNDVELVDSSKVVGGKARVKSAQAPVRAGSTERDYRHRRTVIQVVLGKGSELRILGETGNWYKVSPPEGAYVWISARYVSRPEGQRVTVQRERAKPPKRLERPVVGVTPKKVTKPVTTRPVGRALTSKPTEQPKKERSIFGKYASKMAKLEKEFAEQMKKPVLQQRWDDLIAGYKAISEQKDNYVAAEWSRRRLAMIEYQIDAIGGYQRLLKLQREFEQSQSAAREKMAKLDARRLEQKPRIWQAEGVLELSTVFRGPHMPKRYRLYDPSRGAVGRRTVAYVELAEDSGIGVEKYLGKYVAVSGHVYFDPKLKINIIKASNFKVKARPTGGSAEGK